MPTGQRGRCAECGFPWDIPADEAVAMVGESPALLAQALAKSDPRAAPRPGVWAPAEYLWHMVDVLRIGTERLWTLARDPQAGVPAWDENDLARVRRYAALSVPVGIEAYTRAVADWVMAATQAPADAKTVHSELGAIGAADVVRANAHEAQHHLLDIEQAGRSLPTNVFVARPASGSERLFPAVVAGKRIFDDYVMVDWSANSTPRVGKDSIWVAAGGWQHDALVVSEPVNPPTRHEAVAVLEEIMTSRLDAGRRVVVGFDFPFSYPAGLTGAYRDVFGPGPAWRAVWSTLAQRISDAPDNANNRWDVARDLNAATGCRLFWGCPEAVADEILSPRDRPMAGLAERGPGLARFRLAERRAKGVGGSIQSVWKLAYAGSVGSQTLLGIPRLEQLRRRFEGRVVVWPFETGAARDREEPVVVLAEVWPTIFAVDRTRHPVRDAAQVLEVVASCARADAEGTLAHWLDPEVSAVPGVASVVAEEGWILGVT